MRILIRTDSHIESSENLTQDVEAVVQQTLSRFVERITRVDVYLSDENSIRKFGNTDKRCVIEARLGGLPPIAVSHQGSSVNQAVSGAVDRLETSLKRILGRKDSYFKRRFRVRTRSTDVARQRQRFGEVREQEEFIDLIRPHLGHLSHHAQCALRILGDNGTIHPGQVIAAYLLDEVVTRAWLRFADRPRWIALKLWLSHVLNEIVEELVQHNKQDLTKPKGMTDEGLPRTASLVNDQSGCEWLLSENTAITERNGDPGRQTTRSEKLLAADAMVSFVHASRDESPMSGWQANHIFENAILPD